MSLSESERYKLIVVRDFLKEQEKSRTAPFHDDAILTLTRMDMHSEEEQYRIAKEWVQSRGEVVKELLRRLEM